MTPLTETHSSVSKPARTNLLYGATRPVYAQTLLEMMEVPAPAGAALFRSPGAGLRVGRVTI